MAQTDDDVAKKLVVLYGEAFGGKQDQRYLIAWSDLRSLYGFRRLQESRFGSLAEYAADYGLYLFDLGVGESGHFVAVIKMGTVDRWRKVPRPVIDAHRAPPSDSGEEEAEEEEG